MFHNFATVFTINFMKLMANYDVNKKTRTWLKNSVLHFISAIHSTMAFNKVFHSILGIFYYGRYCIGRKWYVLSLERALHHRRKNQFETWGSSMPVSLSESAFLFLTRQSRFETNVCSRLITNQGTHIPPTSKLSPHQSPPHTQMKNKRKKTHGCHPSSR